MLLLDRQQRYNVLFTVALEVMVPVHANVSRVVDGALERVTACTTTTLQSAETDQNAELLDPLTSLFFVTDTLTGAPTKNVLVLGDVIM